MAALTWWARIRLGLLALLIILFTAASAFGAAVVITPLPAPRVPETTEVLDKDGHVIARLFTENRVEVPVTDMPEYLLNAVVAVEDDRFYVHHGIDVVGIGRALTRNVSAGRVLEGGSTLSQQLARNLYLTQERTVARKIKESVLASKLELTYSKKELLGMYLNTVYLGRGTYGVEVAAQTYFGKRAHDLTLTEAALIAGLPQAPEYYSLPENQLAALERRNVVLDRMAELGYITQAQARTAKAEPLELRPDTRQTNADSQGPLFVNHYVDYVTKELQSRFPQISANLAQGGYRIYTALDATMQQKAGETIQSHVQTESTDEQGRPQPQAALVALEPTTGYVRALIGGRQEQTDLNRALEPRQPGSAFKPFVYAAALETRSFTAVSTQPDSPTEFPGANPGEVWRPANFENKYTNRPMDMRQALRESNNIVAIHWLDTLKPGPVIDLARRAGITSTLATNLTVALGSSEVTPLELTEAYAPFANGGLRVKPIAVLRVEDRNRNVLVEQSPASARAFDPGVAFIMTNMLKDVIRPGGTAGQVAGMLGNRPAAGKSGTTDQSTDAWFVGYTPDLVASVWVGDDARQASSRTGAVTSAPIWADFVSKALAGKPFRDWTPPATVEQVDVCGLTGLLPNPTCPLEHEWFLKGTAPKQTDPQQHWSNVVPSLPGVPKTLPTTPPQPPPASPATESAPLGLPSLGRLLRWFRRP